MGWFVTSAARWSLVRLTGWVILLGGGLVEEYLSENDYIIYYIRIL